MLKTKTSVDPIATTLRRTTCWANLKIDWEFSHPKWSSIYVILTCFWNIANARHDITTNFQPSLNAEWVVRPPSKNLYQTIPQQVLFFYQILLLVSVRLLKILFLMSPGAFKIFSTHYYELIVKLCHHILLPKKLFVSKIRYTKISCKIMYQKLF